MADETQAQETVEQAEHQEGETDWQAKYETMREHMRDWEKKAKANQSAADELEQLKQAQMTEQEKEKARADKAEQELAALKAEQQRLADAREIAASEGVPSSLLEFCADREAMEAFAKAYKAEQPQAHAAASANSSRVISSGNDMKPDRGQIFAEAAGALFH